MMPRYGTAAVAAVLVFTLVGCATTPADTEASKRDCFSVRELSGFTVVDDDTVRVTAGVDRKFELDVSRAGCSDLKFATVISVVGRDSFVCVGDRVGDLRVRTSRGVGGPVGSPSVSTAGSGSCLVKEVRHAVEATEAADESGAEPSTTAPEAP